jgi:putative two-component system response regulator
MIEKGNLLVVDDTSASLKLLTDILKAQGYKVRSAISGELALNAAKHNPPELVLLDIRMPVMDGYEVCQRLKADPITSNIPVIFLSAASEVGDKIQGFSVGAVDYLTKPYQREELIARVHTHLELYRLRHQLEFLVEQRTSQLVESHRETIVTMTRAAAYKDEHTGAHVSRVSYYSEELARRLGMDKSFCDTIHYASPMHDVGKMAIPDAILNKPSEFDPAEWEIMKTHAVLGAKMLSGTSSPYLMMGAEIAAGHHERWDGSGYPLALKGEAIPLSARIMQICDVYDALRSERPYKKAYSHERSTEIILSGDGRTLPAHFDPAIFEVFKNCSAQFQEVFEAHQSSGEQV